MLESGSKRYCGHNLSSAPSEPSEWCQSDLWVGSLDEARAITDMNERIKQVILFEKYNIAESWEELVNDDREFSPVKVLEIHPILRGLFENDCRLTARSVPCSNCGAKNNVPIASGGYGHKRVCPGCSNFEARSRGNKGAHLIYNYDWLSLGFLEITSPSDWINHERLDDHDYLISRQESFIKIVKKFMQVFFINRPYTLTFHHWHSFNDKGGQPCASPHFHCHLTIINSEYRNNDGVRSVMHRPHFIALDVMHDDYKPQEYPYTLEMFRKWLGRALADDPDKGQCHYQYMLRDIQANTIQERNAFAKHSWRKLVHRLTYSFRSFIEDVNSWLLWSDENEQVLNPEHYDWMAWHLRMSEYCQFDKFMTGFNLKSWNRLTRWFGALSQSNVNKWVDWGTKKDPSRGLIEYRDRVHEASKLYCWSCEAELDLTDILQCESVTYEPDKSPLKKILDPLPPWAKMRRWVQ